MYALPKKYKRTEAKLDRQVAERLVGHKMLSKNWALEVKLEGNKPKRHQLAALKQVEDGVFLWKPQDSGARQPVDFIHLGDACAVVCTIRKNNHDVDCVVNGHLPFSVRI